MKKAIIIMAKVPAPGRVKTRLQPFFSEAQSAEISEAFLRDAESKAKSVEENVMIAVAPFEKKHELKNILQHNPALIEQRGENLGEKMLAAFRFVFEAGTDSVVMTGTDSPTFPADFIEQAFEYLELETDVVLGRTEDGGFFLIGLRAPLAPRIFEGVEWSSEKTFEQIRENVMDSGLHLREVPGWYDVDKPEDFEKLRREFMQNENARRRAPQTFEFFANWEKSRIGKD